MLHTFHNGFGAKSVSFMGRLIVTFTTPSLYDIEYPRNHLIVSSSLFFCIFNILGWFHFFFTGVQGKALYLHSPLISQIFSFFFPIGEWFASHGKQFVQVFNLVPRFVFIHGFNLFISQLFSIFS